MTAFDAHLRPDGGDSAWGQAAALMRARPGVLIATIVATATVVGLAFAALIIGQEMRFQIARAADGVQASVFLRPQTSRAAAETLKGRFDAMPFIRDAKLRTKEVAITTLEAANGLPQPSRANPLPDVWIVTLRLNDSADVPKTLSERAAETRRSLAQVPEVESVDLDDGWLATLDRWQALAAAGVRSGIAVLFTVLWSMLICLFFLAGRGLGDAPRRDPVGRTATAIVGLMLGAATLITSAAFVTVAIYGAESMGLDWKPIVDRIGQMSGPSVAALGFSVLVLSVGVVGTTVRR